MQYFRSDIIFKIHQCDQCLSLFNSQPVEDVVCVNCDCIPGTQNAAADSHVNKYVSIYSFGISSKLNPCSEVSLTFEITSIHFWPDRKTREMSASEFSFFLPNYDRRVLPAECQCNLFASNDPHQIE